MTDDVGLDVAQVEIAVESWKLGRPKADAAPAVATAKSAAAPSTEEPALAMAFDELGISAPVLRGLAESNFVRPAPIQAQAIPIAQLGVDLIAQVGTGKTCAFAVVALELLQPGAPVPQALIESRREIATQCATCAAPSARTCPGCRATRSSAARRRAPTASSRSRARSRAARRGASPRSS